MISRNIRKNGKQKQLVIILIVSCFIQVSFGQIEKPFNKGNMLTGGSLALSFDNIKNFKPGINPLPDVTYSTKSTAMESNLSFGYFILNQFAIGLNSEVLLSREVTTCDLFSDIGWDAINTDFLIGPIMRFYTKPGIFIEGSADFNILKSISNNDELKWIKYSVSTGIGYSILVNKSIAIEPVIKYRFVNTDIPEIDENEKLGEFNVSVGLQIYLNMMKSR